MTQTPDQILSRLTGDAQYELISGILPFWINRMPDDVY
jgi:hypothetical protein